MKMGLKCCFSVSEFFSFVAGRSPDPRRVEANGRPPGARLCQSSAFFTILLSQSGFSFSWENMCEGTFMFKLLCNLSCQIYQS